MGIDPATSRINYLRLSVTDRCQLRCRYCTYWRDWRKLPGGDLLRYEELLRLVALAATMGIVKVRVTGGEPLIRRGLVDFLAELQRVPGIAKVCLTTNGVLLSQSAPALYEAGLRHLNISLDTLRRERYWRLTGRDNLPEVLAGLDKAASLGFHPIKINCVVLKGINDDEVLDLAMLARDRPYQVRFIELMPTVSQPWWQRHFLPLPQVLERLQELGPLLPSIPEPASGPARIFRVAGFLGEFGFISPLSGHQCRTCNRLRLSADGRLRPCLFAPHDFDLKASLRLGGGDESGRVLFQRAMAMKGEKAGFPLSRSSNPSRPMVSIGG
jgi:cyclic pyranopterin phosphate synthase|uniref:GTP 3',8-cyclase n=1 Tax=Desulfobacca acetoxidans TaxID=60893 RepID=A0A7C3ZA93_9BACT